MASVGELLKNQAVFRMPRISKQPEEHNRTFEITQEEEDVILKIRNVGSVDAFIRARLNVKFTLATELKGFFVECEEAIPYITQHLEGYVEDVPLKDHLEDVRECLSLLIEDMEYGEKPDEEKLKHAVALISIIYLYK